MKQQTFFLSIALLTFLVFFIATTQDVRKLLSKESADVMRLESPDDKVVEENCENGDEECINRRATADAHLDYIYTQHHTP